MIEQTFSGIPTLVAVDEAGKFITKEGRAFVNEDPEGEDFPWFPTALTELTGAAASKLNEETCVVLFTGIFSSGICRNETYHA